MRLDIGAVGDIRDKSTFVENGARKAHGNNGCKRLLADDHRSCLLGRVPGFLAKGQKVWQATTSCSRV